MEFSRPEYWSGLLFPSPGHLPNPGIEPGPPVLQEDFLPTEPPGKPPRFLRSPHAFQEPSTLENEHLGEPHPLELLHRPPLPPTPSWALSCLCPPHSHQFLECLLCSGYISLINTVSFHSCRVFGWPFRS